MCNPVLPLNEQKINIKLTLLSEINPIYQQRLQKGGTRISQTRVGIATWSSLE